jgi:hypothetical protein
VPDDDDVLEIYEHELEPPFEPMPRRSNRGFWMVAGTIFLGAVVLMVEIFANRPQVNAISRTENDLRVAFRHAQLIYSDGGSFTPADVAGLMAMDQVRTYVDADTSVSEPGAISVYASGGTWAEASRAAQGTCFYLLKEAGLDTKYLVADGDCTAREALKADQPSW